MTHREWLSLALLLVGLAVATPGRAQSTAELRDQLDRFTAAGRSDYAACAQHIALEYQWSRFLRAPPSAAMTKCARDLRAAYEAKIGHLEAALRHDKRAGAALAAYYAEWRRLVDGLKPGPQPALQANLERLDSKAAAIHVHRVEVKPRPRYGDARSAPSTRQPGAQATD